MKESNLLKGNILLGMSKLALPMMMTSFIQMAYNLVDMIWIGRIGSSAVAAVGAAGIYLWISDSIASIAKTGGQIKVAHATGAGESEQARRFAAAAIQMSVLISLCCAALILIFHRAFIDVFMLTEAQTVKSATSYLLITGSAGVLFNSLNQVLTGLCIGRGNAKLPFAATSVGLLVNLVMDPLLIFGLGPFPALGVVGAALATAGAQGIVTLLFIALLSRDKVFFRQIPLLSRPDKAHMLPVWKLGFPAGVQNIFMSGLSLVISHIVAGFGAAAIAVQKVGGQVESISWMVSGGFSLAINAFVGQNYGAVLMHRVKKGYHTALTLMIVWGFLCSALLILFPAAIFRVFISEADVVPLGVDYLRILGISQLFVCMEGAATGAFNGLGQTMIPSISSVIFNLLRIPLALLLSATPLGLNGIWWAVCISSVLKGTILVFWYAFYVRRNKIYQLEGADQATLNQSEQESAPPASEA